MTQNKIYPIRFNYNKYRVYAIAQLLFLLFVLNNGIPANTVKFRNLSVSDGLPHNHVRCIYQDSLGFMWYGTSQGICRYDGYEFIVYNQFNSGLKNATVNAIVQGSDTNIFIGTGNGVFSLNLNSKKITQIAPKSPIANITSMEYQQGKGLWIATMGQGLFFYANNQLRRYLKNRQVIDIELDKDNHVWAGAFNGKIYKHEPTADKFKITAVAPNLIHCLRFDNNNGLWVGTMDKMVIYFDTLNQPRTLPVPNYRNSNIVRCLNFVNNKLYIGTEGGLFIYNNQNKTFESYFYDPSDQQSLAGNAIYSIYSDNEGGIWIGTYFRGLSYMPASTKNIKAFKPHPFKNSVHGSAIRDFLEIDTNALYIASEDNGVSVFNISTGEFTRLKADGKNQSGNVHCLLLNNNELWMGTFSQGIEVYNLQNNKVTHLRHNPNNTNSISSNLVANFYDDKQHNTIWIATSDGINYYNKGSKQFAKLEIAGNIRANAIVKDKNQNLWFVTPRFGLFSYNLDTQKHEKFTTDNSNVTTNEFSDGVEDNYGNLWFATRGYGLLKYNVDSNNFEDFGTGKGLNQRYIFSIESHDSNLWLGTSHGLIKYNPYNQTSVTFTEKDGLPSNYFNFCAASKTTHNTLLFGTVEGFFEIDPENITNNPVKPKAHISKFTVENKKEGILKEWISPLQLKQAKLKHKNNSVGIYMSALSYNQPTANQYKYVLKGYEENWNHTNKRIANYANLPSGKYTFYMMASNDGNVWSDETIRLSFQIRPPVWLSIGAYIFYVFFTILISFVIYRNVRNKLKKKQQEQIQQVKIKKERELNDFKINFFTNLAHEIKTPLTLIKTPLEILLRKGGIPEQIQSELEIMQKNTRRLLNLISQLLEFRKLEEGKYLLKPGQNNIVEIIYDIYERFIPFAENKNIQFNFIKNTDNLMAYIDREAITKVVSNLLTNAFKFANTKITLSLSGFNDNFIIMVEDDGEGISGSKIKDIFKPYTQLSVRGNFKGVGIGLPLSKALVELHNGTLELTSTQGRGTKAIVTINTMEQPNTTTDDNEIPVHDASIYLEEPDLREKQPSFAFNKTILLVEDNTELLNYIGRIFKDNFNVVKTENGREAFEYIKQCKEDPAVIISDVLMPEMDGIELCKTLKQNPSYSHIPIILLTAKSAEMDKIEGLQTGADLYMPKPFNIEILKLQVHNLIDNRFKLHEYFKSHFHAHDEDSTDFGEVKDELIERFIKIVETELDNFELSIENISEELNISRFTLYKKMKSLTGYTPQEFLTQIRLKNAVKLIKQKKYSIKEITYQTGFSSSSYFSTVFRKQFGVSPKEFQKQHSRN